MKFFRKRHLLLLLIILPCFTPLLPIQLSYTFEGTGKVYPVKEWTLIRDPEGGIVSTVYQHRLGVISEVSSYKFERGDIANVHIRPFSSPERRSIQQGDTIATVRSYLLEERINALRLQLEVEKARLKSEQAGSKGPIIAEASQRLAFAREQLVIAERSFQRASQLYNDQVIALAEYERAENEFRLAQIQIDIANSSLDVAKTGEKPELLNFILATMSSIEQELNFLQTKKTGYHIIAPISGAVDYNISEEQILTVDDTSSMVLTVPVRLYNQAHIRPGTPIKVRVPGMEGEFAGVVDGINDEVQILENQQIILVKAKIESPRAHIRKGVMVQCTFVCDTVDLWDYLDRTIKNWNR